MKIMKESFLKAGGLLFVFLIVSVLYTGIVTGAAQLFFPQQAQGSLIEVDGKIYGSELLGQYNDDNRYMWGRIMNIDVTTYKDKDGQAVMYAMPSQLSPASAEYATLVQKRIEVIRQEHPDQDGQAIPVDLVTCSGSGLDPHISINAAQYQIERIAKAQNLSSQAVQDIINQCTDEKFLGIFGEKTVNVLKVNLMLAGIL